MEDRILYRFVAYLFQSHFFRRKAPFLILKVISAIFYSLTIACFDIMSTVFFHILQKRDKYIHVLLNTTILNCCMFFVIQNL